MEKESEIEKDNVRHLPETVWTMTFSQQKVGERFVISLEEEGEFNGDELSEAALSVMLLNILFTHLCNSHGVVFDGE